MNLYDSVLSRLFPRKKEVEEKSSLAIRALEAAVEDMREERKKIRRERMGRMLEERGEQSVGD